MFTPKQQELIRTVVGDNGAAGVEQDWGSYFELPSECFDDLLAKLHFGLLVVKEQSGVPYFEVGRFRVRRAENLDHVLEDIWRRKRSRAPTNLSLCSAG